MAMVLLRCKMLCVTILIFCTFSSIYSLPDTYLEYETVHTLQKRDANVATSEASVLKTTTVFVPTGEKILQDPVKETKDKDNKEKKPYDIKLTTKNVGVNGTGIRKPIQKDATSSVPLNTNANVNVSVTSTAKTLLAKEGLLSDPNIDNDNADIPFPNPFDKEYNKTLIEHHINKTTVDHHQFYNSTTTSDSTIGHKYWVNMTNRSDVKISDLLSQSHRRAATVRLSFEFPFYGQFVRNITIATGGFLYTGEYVHSWLAATQYIAPLMANFDTSLSNDSYIKYVDNGTAFTVQWENVSLQDKPKAGNFTFQTTLFKNGDIVFVYENIPIPIENIQDDHHPVKIGLSDAYISDRTIFLVRRKTIFEYHRVNIKGQHITNWTSIYLVALPTCLSSKDCKTCVSSSSDLKCMWCPGLNRCSGGMDRNRQEWVSRGCDQKRIIEETMCTIATGHDNDSIVLANNTGQINNLIPHYNTSTLHKSDQQSVNDHNDYASNSVDVSYDQPQQQPRIIESDKPVRMGVSSIVTILTLISFVLAFGVWIMYAYRNPHSTSGQILIRYRPSQWSWKRGEARYTAATIHM